MLLNDEEIQVVFDTFLKEHPESQWDSIMMCRAQNKAQLKKVVEWLDEYGRVTNTENYCRFVVPKEEWQALLEEIKV